jgi:hypothetical protein
LLLRLVETCPLRQEVERPFDLGPATAATAAVWLLVPLVRIDRIEAKAKQAEAPAS